VSLGTHEKPALLAVQGVPDSIFVTATEEDVRGSGDTVGTCVVHSPSMRDVLDSEVEPTLQLTPSKLVTFESSAYESRGTAPHPSEAMNEEQEVADELNVSCASHPLSVHVSAASSIYAQQPHDANDATAADDSAPAALPQTPVAPASAIAADTAVVHANGGPNAVTSSVMPVMHDTMMQSPIATIASDLELGPQLPGAAAGGSAGFQFDAAIQGTTPVAFRSSSVADSVAQDTALAAANFNDNDVDMAGNSPHLSTSPPEEAAGPTCPSPTHQEGINSPVPGAHDVSVSTNGAAKAEGLSAEACTMQAVSAQIPGESPAVDDLPPPAVAQAASPAACSSLATQPSKAQPREATPPEQDAVESSPAVAPGAYTPAQSQSAADVETPDSTPVAVALARCRAELNSGCAALGSVSTDVADHTDDLSQQATAASSGQRHQPAGTSSPVSAAKQVNVAAVTALSPLRAARGGARAEQPTIAQDTFRHEEKPGFVSAGAQLTEELSEQKPEYTPADAEMKCDAEDRTIEVCMLVYSLSGGSFYLSYSQCSIYDFALSFMY
jgi:hypothetical protein